MVVALARRDNEQRQYLVKGMGGPLCSDAAPKFSE